MSRKNIEKLVAENYNRTLCLEVAYYNYDSERIIQGLENKNYWNTFNFSQIYALQEVLVKNVQKYPYVVASCGNEWKFFLDTNQSWKRNDYEYNSTRKIIEVLGELIDKKTTLEAIEKKGDAERIVSNYQQHFTRNEKAIEEMEKYLISCIEDVEVLCKGLKKSTKITIFENMLIKNNSFIQDCYEDAKIRCSDAQQRMTELTLESVMNPFVRNDMTIDEEKYQALRTLLK